MKRAYSLFGDEEPEEKPQVEEVKKVKKTKSTAKKKSNPSSRQKKPKEDKVSNFHIFDLFGGEKQKDKAKQLGKWACPKGYRVYPGTESHRPEHYRFRRKHPSPEMLDETLAKMLPLIPREEGAVLITGACYPGVAAAALREGDRLFYCCRDAEAGEALKKLIPDAVVLKDEGDIPDEVRFSLVVDLNEGPAGEKVGERIISLFNMASKGGKVIFCGRAELLLDYTGKDRQDGPRLREKIHRLCKTHFILRPTGALMQPAWDILVLSRRTGISIPGRCRWRITGNGFLPWQKCNEAISTSPWLLVELFDQVATSVARCITYPWEAF